MSQAKRAAEAEAPAVSPKAFDEVHDSPEDLDEKGPLAGPVVKYLRLCSAHLVKPYEDADRMAIEHQQKYRNSVKKAAFLGSAALFLAGLTLAFPEVKEAHSVFPPLLLAVEGICAFVAATYVVIAMIFRRHEEWLLARYQAERLRLLKFEFLVNPDFWCAGQNATTEQLFRSKIEKIRAIQDEHLASWSEQEEVPALPSDATCEHLGESLRLQILGYYRRKRLDFQINYFGERAARDAKPWYQKRGWLPLVFFLSILFAVFHAGAEIFVIPGSEIIFHKLHLSISEGQRNAIEVLGRISLALSLWIPALWAGVRTYRAANEFGRNHSRSLAKQAALNRISERLLPDAPAADVFSDMGLAEYVLASDQGEWLRLMREAEWFG